MSYVPTHYTAESRTVTPGHVAAKSVQSWKKAPAIHAAGAHNPHLIAQEARTASADIDAGRSFSKVLADDRTVHPRGFAGALAMSEAAPAKTSSAAPSSDFSFDDVIDVINPLHHLPVIGMIYRELTGDKIGPVAQIVGGGIFGGPVGAISGTVNAVVQGTTGKDVAGNVIAMVAGDDGTFAVPDAAPGAIDRNDPEMALSIASARITGEEYLPVTTGVQTAHNNAAHQAASAYQRTASVSETAPHMRAIQAHDMAAIDVDYYQETLNAAHNANNNMIIAMPATPVFGGLY